MKIQSIDPNPIYTFDALIADPGNPPKHVVLPVLSGKVDRLPGRLKALLITGDLQAYTSTSLDVPAQHRTLLGEAIASEMAQLGELTDILPNPLYTGVCIAGDMYAIETLDQMGGLGDVDGVWRRFLDHYRWVVGVGGNHDHFGGKPSTKNAFKRLGNIDALDGEHVVYDDLCLAGVSGIIGQKKKVWRREEKSQIAMITRQLEHNPNILILHQGPNQPQAHLRGSTAIRLALEAHQGEPPLVVCGHCHWKTPLATLDNGTQVLNVDFRVVVLTANG